MSRRKVKLPKSRYHSKRERCLTTSLIHALVFIVLLILVIICLTFPAKTSATEDWYNDYWHYRKTISINHNQVSGADMSDFPVLVSITDSDLQAHARSDGHDILFTNSTGVKIPYEREGYTASTGTLIAWVKIASLSHTADTDIYMYYGNAGASDQQDLTGVTWDTNFKGVWHSKDASTTTIADSTSNANTGTKSHVDGPAETVGKIGKAQSYDGSDDSVKSTPSGTIANSFTVSAWAKVLDSDSRTVIGTRNDGDFSFDFKFENDDTVHGDIGNISDWITTEADAGLAYSHDTWYLVTYTVTTTGYTIYINGDEATSGSYPEDTPLLYDSDHNIYFGQVGYDDEWFNGSIDEVRISNVNRSADWIKTEYNNQNSPSTFYSVGSEETGDITPPTVPGIPQATIGKNLTSQVWKWNASTDTQSGLSHYDWRVDGGPSGTAATPTVVTNLPVGTWKFYVKAEDNAGNQSAESSSLLAVLSSSIRQVTVDCSTPLVQVVIPAASVSNPILDLSPITSRAGELLKANVNCGIAIETILPSNTVTTTIPAGTIIEGPARLWTDGTIIPPIPVTPTADLLPVAPSGFANQVSLAIEIGHNVAPLITTKATKIQLNGQAGKEVGYISGNVFTAITNICTGDSQSAGDLLAIGEDCKIDSGNDMVIWTKHFSQFVTYDLISSSTEVTTGTDTLPETGANTIGRFLTDYLFN